MVKKMNVGDAPTRPTRRRRPGFGKGDGYEVLFLGLWVVSLAISLVALLWWADGSLFGSGFIESSSEMRRLIFFIVVGFWAFCSFSLLRFDALAKTRGEKDFKEDMDRFHSQDKLHMEREALLKEIEIEKIRGSTAKSDDSEEKKPVVEISSESKGEAAEDSASSEE
jgi:hypothetical protein